MPSISERLRYVLRPEPKHPQFALVLSGGGARAAYQAGVIRYIAEEFPESAFQIMTGVSAGAINTSHLASHEGALRPSAASLVESWRSIRVDHVFESQSSLHMVRNWLKKDKEQIVTSQRGLLDTSPLRAFLARTLGATDGVLTGVKANIEAGRLAAYAIVTTNYATGQTVSWVQGENIEGWERPNRVGVNTTLTLDHIMASTALPILFPAVRIGDAWYGDGGVRLSAPLAPAVHLGADRMLIISTRYARSRAEASDPAFVGYPPMAQVIGLLMNAIFLDTLDQDALMLERINTLLHRLPEKKRGSLRPIRMLMLRPSVDLGRLAGTFDVQLSGALGLLTRGIGTGETKSPDWLSMLLFEESYVDRLIMIGQEDAHRQHEDIARFLQPDPPAPFTRRLRKVFT